MISKDEYFQDPQTKEDRRKLYPTEITQEIEDNAEKLIAIVNNLLEEISWKSPEVSSGWRPKAVNDKTANAAAKSKHMTGNACDIKDLDGSLKKLVTKDLLIKYGLYCEHFDYTKTWVHFQNISPKSGNRFFIP